MAQFSVEITRPPGSVLGGNQHVEGRIADPMLAAELRHRKPPFRLAQHAHDLAFRETALLHRNLLVDLAEKILQMNPLNDRGDYRTADKEVYAG